MDIDNISDRVAETCEDCDLKKAPVGAFLCRIIYKL